MKISVKMSEIKLNMIAGVYSSKQPDKQKGQIPRKGVIFTNPLTNLINNIIPRISIIIRR